MSCLGCAEDIPCPQQQGHSYYPSMPFRPPLDSVLHRHKRCMSTGKIKTRKTAGRISNLGGSSCWSDSKSSITCHRVQTRCECQRSVGGGILCVVFSLSRSNQQQLLVAACNASFFERFENGLDLQTWPERPTAAEYDKPKGFSLARTCLARHREGILASKCIFVDTVDFGFLLVIFT